MDRGEPFATGPVELHFPEFWKIEISIGMGRFSPQ